MSETAVETAALEQSQHGSFRDRDAQLPEFAMPYNGLLGDRRGRINQEAADAAHSKRAGEEEDVEKEQGKIGTERTRRSG